MSQTKPNPTTGQQLAKRLRRVANTMEKLGTDIDFYGGFAAWSLHCKQMVGAAAIARQWALEIEGQATAGEIKRGTGA